MLLVWIWKFANVIAACQSSFTLGPITSEFVSKTINQLKPNKATGLDKLISACMLKDAVTVITPSLTQLFNLSIQTKTFPTIWKNARIMPIHKSGNPSNYMPISISILPSISKILEKTVYTQPSSFLDTNELLSSRQFGFRLNSSTVSATTKFCDKVA